MKFTTAFSAAAILLVTGCTTLQSDVDVDKAAAMPSKGDAFSQALHRNYVDRATFEKGEYDWDSVAFFVRRATMAADGIVVRPQSPADRNLSHRADIDAAHAKLVAALETSAPKDAPKACAEAQTWLEHWMEQEEEGIQPDHIAMARAGFDKAIAMCKAKPMVAMPEPFTVYFAFGSAKIDDTARQVLAKAAMAFKSATPSKVMVVGHTDTVGSTGSNAMLSAKRADMVATQLAKMGIPAMALEVASKGETTNAVNSGDNAEEGKNRRVEIVFVK